jgi:hypothetical protein
MPNGIVVRPRLASLALVAALAASSHVASATPTPRRALFQVQDTVAESVASISQAVADVADSTAQAVVDVATRVAEEVEASMAPAPAPQARRRSLLQSSVLKRLEEEIMKEQRKIAEEFEASMAPAPAPESVMGDGDDYVDAEAPEADETRRRSLLTYDMAPAPAPADDAIDVEEYTSMPEPAAFPPVAEPDLDKRRRSLLQADYVDYDDFAPAGAPVDALEGFAPAPAPA